MITGTWKPVSVLSIHREERWLSAAIERVVGPFGGCHETQKIAACALRMLAALPPIHQHDIICDLQEIARRRNRRHRARGERMWRSFFASVVVSASSHTILYFLATSLKYEVQGNKADKDMVFWAIQMIVAPFLSCMVVSMVRMLVMEKEIDLVEFNANEAANLWLNTLSKAAFFAIKEFPAHGLLMYAHIASFAVEFCSALYLAMVRGFWNPDVPDI